MYHYTDIQAVYLEGQEIILSVITIQSITMQ